MYDALLTLLPPIETPLGVSHGGNYIYFFKTEISKICKNCVEQVKHVEKSYWKTDRTIDTKLDKLRIALKVEDNKDNNSEYKCSTEE